MANYHRTTTVSEHYFSSSLRKVVLPQEVEGSKSDVGLESSILVPQPKEALQTSKHPILRHPSTSTQARINLETHSEKIHV